MLRTTTRERSINGELVRRARLRGGKHALALGCGTGTLSVAIALAHQDASVTGLDADPEALALDRAGKRRALLEALRVTKPGGRLLIADWGRPKDVVSRLLFLAVQIVDGFATTHDNMTGFLPDLILEAGFSDIREVRTISTLIGVIRIVEALRGGSTSRRCAREVSTVLAGLPVGRPSCTSR